MIHPHCFENPLVAGTHWEGAEVMEQDEMDEIQYLVPANSVRRAFERETPSVGESDLCFLHVTWQSSGQDLVLL